MQCYGLFSTLDLCSGYWQLNFNPEDKEKTALVTLISSWAFLRVPFGLSGAPASFDRAMQIITSGLNYDLSTPPFIWIIFKPLNAPKKIYKCSFLFYEHETTKRTFPQNHIQIRYILAYCPNWGGVYEKLIGLRKTCH